MPRYLLFAFCFLLFAFLQAQPSTAVREGVRLFESGNYTAALPYLQEAVQQNPQEEQLAVALAVACVQAKRPVLARSAIENGANRFPQNLAFKQLKSEILIQDAQFTQALSLLQELNSALGRGQTLTGVTRAQIQNRIGQVHLIQGSQLAQQDAKEQALAQFQQALRYLPDSVNVHQNISLIYLHQTKWQEALQATNAGLHRFPRNEPLLQMKGKSLLELKKYEEALPIYEILYRQNGDIETGVLYGQLQGATGKPADAQLTFKGLMEKYPQEEKLYDLLIKINEQGLNMNGVVAVLKQKRAAFPTDAKTVKRLAQTYEVQEKFDLARKMYDTLTVMTHNINESAFSIAKTYEKQDSLGVAIQKYQEILSNAPTNITVLQALGTSQLQLKRWNDAKATFLKWQIADSLALPPIYRLAFVQEQLGETDNAKENYLKSITKGAIHPLPYIRYGMLLENHPQQCTYLENGLRKALREAKILQEQVSGGVQSNDLSQEANQRIETKKQLTEMDSLGTQAYQLFSKKCPPTQVETLSHSLLREYAGSGKLHYLLGTFYLQQNWIEKAKFQFEEAATFSPALVDNQIALAQILAAQEDWTQAILVYERIITVMPQHPLPYQKLVELYQKIGRLQDLGDKWIARFRNMPKNDLLKEALIECLHKSNRFAEAALVLSGKI